MSTNLEVQAHEIGINVAQVKAQALSKARQDADIEVKAQQEARGEKKSGNIFNQAIHWFTKDNIIGFVVSLIKLTMIIVSIAIVAIVGALSPFVGLMASLVNEFIAVLDGVRYIFGSHSVNLGFASYESDILIATSTITVYLALLFAYSFLTNGNETEEYTVKGQSFRKRIATWWKHTAWGNDDYEKTIQPVTSLDYVNMGIRWFTWAFMFFIVIGRLNQEIGMTSDYNIADGIGVLASSISIESLMRIVVSVTFSYGVLIAFKALVRYTYKIFRDVTGGANFEDMQFKPRKPINRDSIMQDFFEIHFERYLQQAINKREHEYVLEQQEIEIERRKQEAELEQKKRQVERELDSENLCENCTKTINRKKRPRSNTCSDKCTRELREKKLVNVVQETV